MTRPGFIEVEEPDECELCGKFEETRPYGPGGKRVCFDCMMLDEEEAERQFAKHMGWEETVH